MLQLNISPRQAFIPAMGAVAVLMAIPTAAIAQDETEQSPPDYLEALKTCQTLTDDAARLACYDDAVGNVVTATEQGEVRIVDSEDVKKTRRGLFGFSLPDVNIFGGNDGKSDRLDLLESVVTKVRVVGRNTVLLTIKENGAVWRIPNASAIVKRTKPGDTVVFKAAAMGSYFVRINGRNGVKGRRVE